MADTINETLENLRAAIEANTAAAGQCCQPKGSKTGAEPSTQAPAYGEEGDEYEDEESFFNARCNSSNAIYDTILGLVNWLDDNAVEWKALAFGGLTAGLAFALLAAGPGGWAIGIAGTIVTSLSIWLIRESFDFGDLATALDDKHTELVKALYNTSDTGIARSNFLSILAGATPTPSSAELYLVEIAMGDDLLNNILEPRSDMAAYESPDPVVCGTFTTRWTFPTEEGWAFRDDSSGSYSATGEHVPGDGAWETELVGVGGASPTKAKGTIWIDSLSIAVVAGDSVQLDFGPLSSGPSSSKHIKVIYVDTSEYTISVPGIGAGTCILPITTPGTIEGIECWVQRSWFWVNFTFSMQFLEVRVQ